MSDEVTQNLLGSIPTGAEIHDPREGEHPNAQLFAAEIVEQSNGPALKLTYNNMVDSEGRDFQHQERYTIPTSASEQFIQGMFLDLVRNLGVVPRAQKKCPLFDTDADRTTLVDVLQTVIGVNVPLRLKMDDKSGYLRGRILRQKVSKEA